MRLSRYVVIDEIGRGGMGIVLRAYDPKLQREVALKVLRTEDLTTARRTRLIREARAMAQLSHQNVVGVYDVQPSRGGDIALVMELVRGPTLRRWLQQTPRSWSEVVDMVAAAGDGLAAAHRHGLVHGDFKPDNVVVGDDDRARVTDFGLVTTHDPGASGDMRRPRWTPHRTLDPTPQGADRPTTQTGGVVGTPPYLAPELLRGEPANELTDQFAYCVTLWEGLCGDRPYAGRTVVDLAIEMSSGEPRVPASPNQPRWVLDILRRGLEVDPWRRWPSMEHLLAALRRGRRRRRVRSAAFLMAAGATLAVAAFAWQHAEERRRFDACVAESDSIASVWNESRARAIGRAFEATDLAFAAETWSRSEAYADAYVDAWQRRYSTMCERSVVLGTLDSASTSAARDCLTERRDEFAAMVDAASEPDAAAVRRSATAFASLARVDRCLDPASLERHASPPYSGPQRTRIHGVRARLARVYAAIASGRYDDANERAEAVLHEAQDLGWEPLIAEARLARGDAWSGLGRYEDAARESTEAYFEATAAMRDEAALRAANQLVHLLGQPLARPDEALQWSRRSEALVHRLGMERDLLEAFRLNAVGIVHRMRGDYAEAKAAHELSIAIKEEVLGPDHPHLANSLDNLGNALRLTKEHDSSLPLHRRALEIRRRSLGPNHPDVAVSMTNLGNWYAARGDAADRALELYRGALAIWKQTLEPDHPRLAAVLNNIGNLHWGRGEYEEALASHERAMLIREAAHGPNHHTVAASLHNIGLVHQSRGELADALAHFERAKAIATTVRGPKHPQVAMHLHSIGEVYAERGDLVAAIAAYEEALTIKQRAGLDARDVTLTQFALAEALSRHGGHRRRSRALAIAARDGYRSLGPAWVDSLAEVEAWLDAHPPL